MLRSSKTACFVTSLFCLWTSFAFASHTDKDAEPNTLAVPEEIHHFYDGWSLDTTGGGITISNEDGSQTFSVGGQVVLMHSRFGGAYNVDASGKGHFTQETQLQSARVTFSGHPTPNWAYAIQIANRANDNNDRNDDAYMRIAKIVYTGWDWAILSMGRLSPFFGTDNMHDNYNIYGTDFAMLSDAFSPPPSVGISLHSTEKYQPWLWSVGLFHIGTTIQESRSDLRGERGYQQESHLYIGRLGRIFYEDVVNQQLFFGQISAYKVNGDGKKVAPISLDGGLLGTLLPSNSPPVTSGPFADSATQDSSYAFDIGVSAVNGRFSAEAEYGVLHTKFSHVDASNPLYQSMLIQAGWVLTGESREFDRSAGYLLGVKPQSPKGAVEVVGRIEHIDLTSDTGPPEVSKHTGDRATTYSAGLVWYLNTHVRFATNLAYLDVHGPFVSDNSGFGGTVQANFYF